MASSALTVVDLNLDKRGRRRHWLEQREERGSISVGGGGVDGSLGQDVLLRCPGSSITGPRSAVTAKWLEHCVWRTASLTAFFVLFILLNKFFRRAQKGTTTPG
ncbi:hypothetical protein J6590_004013 [Homalodisca vitripennis]|nr:hypothetical protein J6590_004013 [Homalodisca vitripennis]